VVRLLRDVLVTPQTRRRVGLAARQTAQAS
jgi:hypothetical protein